MMTWHDYPDPVCLFVSDQEQYILIASDSEIEEEEAAMVSE